MKATLSVVSGIAILALSVSLAAPIPSGSAIAGAAPSSAPLPVVENMHQFMEYAFEPVFHRLKEQMAKPPQDKKAWSSVKSDSLILAEAGNLLLIRSPEENRRDWDRVSCAQREAGGKLYLAARKRDYEAARKHYTVMVAQCNACHAKFADGEHQLEP